MGTRFRIVVIITTACAAFWSGQLQILALESESSKNSKNGIYLVLRADRAKSKIEPVLAGEKVIVDDGRFLEESERDPAEFVVVEEKSFIPFKLDQKPVEGYTQDNKPKVYLQFAKEQAQDLDTLTGNNVGKRIAVVIHDQIVSCHKIKEALKGGKMQISRCTKESCKLIFSDLLKDNAQVDRNE
ncbi:hypothetical protein KA183_11810 [bacterium]|nr:hypothetical protein [bacterium]QQR57059.1 MAG: hypothetical protein IPG59_19035 [Candidatus Melainabacteria bacterium]